MKTKREQIIEILDNYIGDYGIGGRGKRLKESAFNLIADAILALDEQKERESAEEILDKYWSKSGQLKKNVLKAMEEYAQQFKIDKY